VLAGAPVINSPNTASGTFAQTFNYQIVASSSPTGYDATGMAPGLTVDISNGVISGTPQAGGIFNAMISATNGSGTGTQALTITIAPASQSITFDTQSTPSRSFSAGSSFVISPLATASSTLTVIYSATSSSVCTVAGTTVTMVAAGTCTLAANQAGNANYAPATQVTRSVSITAVAPGAPVIGVATPGNGQALIAFTPPANNGGTPITGYAVSCTPSGSANGSTTPVLVGGLANGTTYTCSVTATNGIVGPASGIVQVTPQALVLDRVLSRKTHGGVDYDLLVDHLLPITGAIAVEPRTIGPGHRVVFQFNNSVS